MSKGTHCWKHDVWFWGECPRCLAEESVELQRLESERQEEALREAEEWRNEVRERQEEEERAHSEAREREYEAARDREERRHEQHEELVRLREREIYERNNPGDYECPECLFISLKRGATRCPTCHVAISTDHWPPIYEAERKAEERRKADAKRKAEEWERARPERERKEAEAARHRATAHVGTKTGVSGIGPFVGLALVALIAVWFSQTLSRSSPDRIETSSTLNPTPPPQRLPDPYRQLLGDWLAEEPRFRGAELSDCDCPQVLEEFGRTHDQSDPYYVAADLNADGAEDFAVVLVDRTTPKSARDGNLFVKIGIVIFNGPVTRGLKPSALLELYGGPPHNLLHYRKDLDGLLVGPMDSDDTSLIVAKGDTYVIK